jgi:hypothetical protein
VFIRFYIAPIGIRLLLVIGCALVGGCATQKGRSSLPVKQQLVVDQLVVHSDFHLPKNHRLIKELTSRRNEIARILDIPTSDESIHVFLFDDETHFQAFMERAHPEFPGRRAFFVKSDNSLNVYAYWGPRVGDDLRHEVTHGYLHSVIPNLPIWLDEGLAEYFEIKRGKQGLNGPHIYSLSNRMRRLDWRPDLARLEALQEATEMNQLDYAESWLWVHFLLSGDEQTRKIVQNQMKQLIRLGVAEPMAESLAESIPDCESKLISHLRRLEGKSTLSDAQRPVNAIPVSDEAFSAATTEGK